jgi:uncharacterized protein
MMRSDVEPDEEGANRTKAASNFTFEIRDSKEPDRRERRSGGTATQPGWMNRLAEGRNGRNNAQKLTMKHTLLDSTLRIAASLARELKAPLLLQLLVAPVVALLLCGSVSAAPIKTAIIQGQSNGSHNMSAEGMETKKILESTGLFSVEVVTTPAKGQDMSGFKPNFSAYDLVVFNYDGDLWSQETEAAFVKWVQDGGGMVVFHSADNAFPRWKEFNEMVAVGGWGGRNQSSGPYLRFRDGKWVPLNMPGPGGSHGRQHPYVVTTREPKHPVMEGLPAEWMHVSDELYDRMRGPATNVTVLASSKADSAMGGSGEEEPILMAISYGKGRIFHSVMGHSVTQLKCVGFSVTLQRGAEWAATGKVTQKLPTDFPTATETKSRP